jgi:hypothetical protein
MFRITFTCDDRNLSRIMHALAGQAYDLQVVPVAGSNPELKAVDGSGRSKPDNRSPQLKRADIVAAGGAAQMLIKVMRQHKLTEINARKVKEICAQLGLSTTSYSHLLSTAVQQGLLKRGGKDPNFPTGFIWKLAGDK